MPQFSGAGGGGAQLLREDPDTVYLGRLVGTTWTDITGGVTAHTVQGGGLQLSESNVPGQLAMYCGASDYVEYSAGGTDWKRTGDITVEAVVRVQSPAGTPYVVWCGGDPVSALATENAHYGFGWSSSNWRFVSESGSGSAVTFSSSNIVIPDQAPWFHVAFTRATDVIKLYVNGSLVGTSGTLTTPDSGANAVLKIGSGGSTVYNWDGYIRDVRISDVAKTDADMLAAARAATGGV